MGVTPVRALISIKIEVIGRVANNPVPLRILRNDFGDRILGIRLTFLAERLSIRVLYKVLYIIGSYPIVFCNPYYRGSDKHEGRNDDPDYRNNHWQLTSFYIRKGRAITAILRGIYVAIQTVSLRSNLNCL